MVLKAMSLLFLALAATAVPDPLMWIWQNAWPRQQQIYVPEPRPADHRKVHRPAPKVAKREWEPIPGVRPLPSIAKPEKRPSIKKQRIARLPSCSVVKREYDRMSHGQRMAAYWRATSEQVAHGRKCLGF